MAVEARITGGGRFDGTAANIADYTVTEDSIPSNLADSTGGVGQFTINVLDDPSRFGSAFLIGSEALLTDGERGGVSGIISSLDGTNGNLRVTVDSRLVAMVREVTVPGFVGTFEQAVMFYFGYADITSDVAVSADLSTRPVNARGYTGDLWTMFKQLLSFHGADVSVIKETIVVRPMRDRNALRYNNSSEEWSLSYPTKAAFIPVAYHNVREISNGLVYPVDGWDEGTSVFQVASGGRVERVLEVGVSLTSVQSPVAIENVPQFESDGSNYSVIDRDGVAVSPTLWTSQGGSVVASIGETPTSINVVVTGPRGMADRSPFRLAQIGHEGQDYSTLRIYGSGTGFETKQILCPTGAEVGPGVDLLGPLIDAPFISSRAEAYEAALQAVTAYNSPLYTVSLDKTDVVRPDEERTPVSEASFDDFTAYAATESLTTFANFNTEWTGSTFADFNQYWYDLTAEDYSRQVFGNAAGSRFPWRRMMCRVRQARITATSVKLTAEADTTFGDFNESAGVDMTFASFNAKYADMTFGELSLAPLPNVKPEYER